VARDKIPDNKRKGNFMERHLDEELKELHKEILKMGVLVQEAIYKSIEALRNRDKRQAQEVINADNMIDELELAIDERCIDLIARYQPMAGDLRFITTGMKINAELERIADLAVDISQRVLELADKPLLKPLIDIPKLSTIAQNMVRDAIDSFVKKNVDLAGKVVLTDSEADELRNRVQEELINDYMARDASTADRAVPLLLIARHLERICDHATNIAEDVIYMVKAKVVKHHPEELR
jgi:phosphate transport system protein